MLLVLFLYAVYAKTREEQELTSSEGTSPSESLEPSNPSQEPSDETGGNCKSCENENFGNDSVDLNRCCHRSLMSLTASSPSNRVYLWNGEQLGNEHGRRNRLTFPECPYLPAQIIS